MRISDWSSDVCSSDLRERNDEISQTKCVVLARKRFMAVAGRADRGADRPDPALDLTQGGAPARRSDRKSVVSGKSVLVRVDPGGTHTIKNTTSIIPIVDEHHHTLHCSSNLSTH